MNTSRRAQWLLAAAVAALPAMMIASPASAQYQAQQNGHALDANTQAGSGGQNNAAPSNSTVSGNDIVTGNVTGGRAFRGNVPYFNQNSFNGNLPSQDLDNFVRDSNGVPSAYAPSFSSNQPRTFYSVNSLATAPPPGFVSENFQGAVVGSGLPSSSFSTLPSGLDALRSQNLGNTTVYGVTPGTVTNNVTELPPPGSDVTGFSATPLISTAMFENANSQSSETSQFNMALPQLPNSPNDRFGSATLLSQDQLNSANPNNPNPSNPQNQSTNNNNLPGQTGPNGPNGPNAGPNGPNAPANAINPTQLNTSINPTKIGNQPNNDNNPLGTSGSLNQQPMNTPLNPYSQQGPATPLSNPSYASSLSTGQGAQQWLQVPPAKQSAQYRVLQQRLDDFNSKHQLTDQQAYLQYQQQLMTQMGAKPPAGGGPGGVGPAPSGVGPGPGGVVNPGGAPIPSGSGANTNNPNNPIKPSDLGAVPHISSLADGVRNATLRSLLTSAEDLMRQDKFASAVEKYDSAIQLTNNTNPLILLGRANAELGSELYARAEGDLRRAVAADSAVLMGQYDLNKMMDPKRIDAVRDDLQNLAKDSKEVRPSLLLAYLSYNTGHDAEAQKYLADAEKLVGNNDPLVELMRTHWSFQSPQLNDANK